MPKMKTKRAAAKRFRLTGSGKIVFRPAGLRHLLEHKNRKRRRNLGRTMVLAPSDEAEVRRLLCK